MDAKTTFYHQLHQDGFIIKDKTDLHYVSYAMRTTNEFAEIILFIDNRTGVVSCRRNIAFVKNVLMEKELAHLNMTKKILTVIITNGNVHLFKNRNSIIIDSYNNTFATGRIERDLEYTKQIILHTMNLEFAGRMMNGHRRPKRDSKPIISYILILLCVTSFLFIDDVMPYVATKSLLEERQLYRVFTSLFMHASLWHVLSNMLALYLIGPAVERIIGGAKLLTLYILSGACGCIYSLNQHTSYEYTLGASGCIYGIIGAALVIMMIDTFSRHRQIDLAQYVFYVVLSLLTGFFYPGIDGFAHSGGLICGMVAISVFFLCDAYNISRQDMAHRKKYASRL